MSDKKDRLDGISTNPLLIHGGGFISGYKEMNSLFANYLAQRGFVVFNINYRLAYPTINVFDQYRRYIERSEMDCFKC